MTFDKAGSFAALISAFVCSSLFLISATSLPLPL
jgi:hypothetical protein